jgi:PAS domain S-box-containing protein
MDAIVVTDQDGRITQWNPQAERMFGWRSEDAEGRLVSDLLVPERYRLDHEKGLSHFRRTGTGPVLGRVRELAAMRRDGTEVPIDLSITLALREGDQATFVGYLRDVSARQRSERIQGLRFVVAGVLSEAHTLTDATQGVITAIGTRLRVPVVALWAPTLGGLGSDRQWSAPDRDGLDELTRLTGTTTVTVGTGLPGRVWSQGRTLRLSEVVPTVEDVDRVRSAHRARLDHAVAVPVSSGDRVLAVIEVFHDQEADVDEETLRTLTDIGAQLGQFMARRRAETLQESPERLQSLLEHATEAIITVADDGAILGLNERSRRLFGYSSLEVMGEDVRSLVAEADRGRLTDHVADSIAGQAGRRWVDVMARRRDGVGTQVSFHVVPLSVGERHLFICIVAEGASELRVIRPDDAAADRLA